MLLASFKKNKVGVGLNVRRGNQDRKEVSLDIFSCLSLSYCGPHRGACCSRGDASVMFTVSHINL